MKILKYKKLKKGMYKIYLEGYEIEVPEDLILKYEILLLDEIDDPLLSKLIEERNFYYGYNLAIKNLSRKMRSIREMEKYLESKEVLEEHIDKIIKKLIEDKYLNDKDFAIAFINDKINLGNDGPYKIRRDLQALNIREDIIESEIYRFTEKIEETKINKIIEKKVKGNKNKSDYLLKRKIYEDLMNMGYTKEIIISIIDENKLDSPEILIKQREKLYKKYGKKYEGEELEYRVKNELYRLGFRE